MTLDRKLIVFGAGGHGKVVADVATQSGWTVVGFVDDAPDAGVHASLPFPVAGDRASVRAFLRDGCQVALGIGSNHAREAIARFLQSEGTEAATIISHAAIVSPWARIGAGTVIMPGAVVNAMAILGEGIIVNTGAVIEHDSRIGKYAHISPNSTLGGGAIIGEFAHIALGAIVLPFVCIGNRSTLGAGSVATRTLPDDVIAFGVPARIQRQIAQKQN